MGVVVEKFSDEKGMVWPKTIAPFRVHLVRIGDDEKVVESADELYGKLSTKGVEVLYDDRNARPGEMLADADLMGMPYRVVVSSKSIKSGGVEFKVRTEIDSDILPPEELISKIA